MYNSRVVSAGVSCVVHRTMLCGIQDYAVWYTRLHHVVHNMVHNMVHNVVHNTTSYGNDNHAAEYAVAYITTEAWHNILKHHCLFIY